MHLTRLVFFSLPWYRIDCEEFVFGGLTTSHLLEKFTQHGHPPPNWFSVAGEEPARFTSSRPLLFSSTYETEELNSPPNSTVILYQPRPPVCPQLNCSILNAPPFPSLAR